MDPNEEGENHSTVINPSNVVEITKDEQKKSCPGKGMKRFPSSYLSSTTKRRKTSRTKKSSPKMCNSRTPVVGSIAASVKQRRKRKALLQRGETEVDTPTVKSTNNNANNKRNGNGNDEITLTSDEMQKLLPDKRVLALITLDKDKEVQQHLTTETEHKTAIIITDTPPSVPKLTRFRARKLKEQFNRRPHTLTTSLKECEQDGIASLIKDELHSDEDDDDEYVLQEEDLLSDDEANLTASDQDSCPPTPSSTAQQQQQQQQHYSEETEEEISVFGSTEKERFTDDGLFKIPMDKNQRQSSPKNQSDLEIASRTRSKLCLQETSIEAIESEFIPPDLDYSNIPNTSDNYSDAMASDNYWAEFLNNFMMPFNTTTTGDDDDLVNDPEYVAAAEKEFVDAEELREAHIPKKELNDLMEELFDDLLSNTLLLDSDKLPLSDEADEGGNNNGQQQMTEVINHQIMEQQQSSNNNETNLIPQTQTEILNEENLNQMAIESNSNYYNQNSSSGQFNSQNNTNPPEYQDVPLTLPVGELNTADGSEILPSVVKLQKEIVTPTPEIIAVPMKGIQHCFQLVKVQQNAIIENVQNKQHSDQLEDYKYLQTHNPNNYYYCDKRYSRPYDDNFTSEYISVGKHLLHEHIRKFQDLQESANVVGNDESDESNRTKSNDSSSSGFTNYQYQLFHQQLRIHVQLLTQTCLQTHFHPNHWKMSIQSKNLLNELKECSLHIYNLEGSFNLIERWEEMLKKTTPENKEMMEYVHEEIELTSRNTRQIARFPVRFMEFILDSDFFIYPEYLPRIPFKAKCSGCSSFAPSESYLIALGLEKHLNHILHQEKTHHKVTPLLLACKRLAFDTIHGKHYRSIYRYVKKQLEADYYNPIKYYFDHKRAPPIEGSKIISFPLAPDMKPLRERVEELPIAWKTYSKTKTLHFSTKKKTKKKENTHGEHRYLNNSVYQSLVFEAVSGEDNRTVPDVVVNGQQQQQQEEDQRATTIEDGTLDLGSSTTNNATDSEHLVDYTWIPIITVEGQPSSSAPPSLTSINKEVPAEAVIIRLESIPPNPPDIAIVDKNPKNPKKKKVNVPPPLRKKKNCTKGAKDNNCSSGFLESGGGLLIDNNQKLDETPIGPMVPASPPSVRRCKKLPATHKTPVLLTRHKNRNTSTNKKKEGEEEEEVIKLDTVQKDSEKEKEEEIPLVTTTRVIVTITNHTDNPSISNHLKSKERNFAAQVSSNSNVNDKEQLLINNSAFTKTTTIAPPPPPSSDNKAGGEQLIIEFDENCRRNLENNCQHIFELCQLYWCQKRLLYVNCSPILSNCYWRFRLLQDYTKFLHDLKGFCLKAFESGQDKATKMNSSSGVGSDGGAASTSIPNSNPSSNSNTNTNTCKRTYRQISGNSPRGEEDEVVNSSGTTNRLAKKIHRQEETYRHMLLPDCPEETIRKDTIFSYNFYVKVEETFLHNNQLDKYKKFNQILRSFDPKSDNVPDLYRRMEELFLPEYPELAQIFLNFLLPSDAAEVGKFFEHFMLKNMTTFVNKLNIFFNKQPAQIRKIYNCISDLSKETNLDMNRIEMKILPLLKGNPFLIEWFQQQFQQSTPPERLLSIPEQINLKDCESRNSYDSVETVNDIMETTNNNTNTTTNSPQQCQLRYIKGRIFYGSKMILPAKLAFLAKKLDASSIDGDKKPTTMTMIPPSNRGKKVSCVHGIRAYGERRLQNTLENSEDVDNKPEEPKDKVVVMEIDDDSDSSLEICDENTLRAHAARLNPTIYATSSASASSSSTTQNNGSTSQIVNTSTSSNTGTTLATTTTCSSAGTLLTTNKKTHQGSGVTNDENLGKTSPRKTNTNTTLCNVIHNVSSNSSSSSTIPNNTTSNSSSSSGVSSFSPSPATSSSIREKRKSPCKKSAVKSSPLPPLSTTPATILAKDNNNSNSCNNNKNTQVQVPDCSSPALNCAKRLKYLTEEEHSKCSKQMNVKKKDEKTEEVSSTSIAEEGEDSPPPPPPSTSTKPWTRDEDKIILIELKMGSHRNGGGNLFDLLQKKLPERRLEEIQERHNFLIDLLMKLRPPTN